MEQTDDVVVVIPVYGLADHGLGLPLDAEEIVGSAVLAEAVTLFNEVGRCRVLPPVRLGLAPYPSCFFGVGPETAHDFLREIADCVENTGFHKLVFFSTSPWNEELIDAASRDARASLGVQSFVVNLSGLGLDFHPASEQRTAAQAVAARVLARPASPSRRPEEVIDPDFRPGNWRQPPPLPPAQPGQQQPDGGALLDQAGERLARLLAEIAARAPLGRSDHQKPAPIVRGDAIPPAPVFPRVYRARYLAAFTRDELETLPHKNRALVIIPTGAIEQHGPHLPVGVDAMLGQAWLAHTLPKLPGEAAVYVAPCITFGKSNEHIGFAGTLSVSAKILRRLVLALVQQLHQAGFRQIALLNTHGGNSAVLVYTIRELQSLSGLRIGLLGQPYKPDLSAQEAEYGFHGGEWETSLMLAIAPELVDMTKAVTEYPARIDDPGELRPENAPAIFSWITSDVSKSGVMGDAKAASAEKGRRWLEAGSAALADRILQLLGRA